MTSTRSTRNRPRRDILEDLEGDGNTLGVLSLAWSIIELHSTGTLLRAYGLSSQDPKADSVLHLPVAMKLKRLKTLGLLSVESFDTIQRFKKERDNIFHMGGLFFPNYTEQVKRQLMDMAITAADVMHDLAEQSLKPPIA